MLSVVMALCLLIFTIWNSVRSLSRIFLIRILWNLVTVFSTMMSSLRPAMTMAWALSVTPVGPSVHTYAHTYVRIYIRLSKQRPLSNSNTFDQNFMKLVLIVQYHNVFFKFDNGQYCTMLSVVMALCLWKFTIWNNVHALGWIFLIRILWNLFTLFSIMMSSSSSIMVHIIPCFQ